MSYYQRRYREGSYGYGVPKMMSRPKLPPRVPYDSGNYSWQSISLPAWEKKFCEKVGGMPWRRFVQAKKNLYKTDKVFEWNDSAGLMAFNEAKQRFCAEFHGFRWNKRLPSADMYVDKNIDWNPKIDPLLSSEIKSASDDDDDGVGVAVAEKIDWLSIPLEQIIATGWDVVDDNGLKLPQLVGR